MQGPEGPCSLRADIRYSEAIGNGVNDALMQGRESWRLGVGDFGRVRRGILAYWGYLAPFLLLGCIVACGLVVVRGEEAIGTVRDLPDFGVPTWI